MEEKNLIYKTLSDRFTVLQQTSRLIEGFRKRIIHLNTQLEQLLSTIKCIFGFNVKSYGLLFRLV